MKFPHRMLLTCATGMLILGLTGTAHAAETGWKHSRQVDDLDNLVTHAASDVYTFTGWKYSRHVDDFDDSVTHIANNTYLMVSGKIFSVNVACDKARKLYIFLNPGKYAYLQTTTSADIRVDKKPKQNFDVVWHKKIAVLIATPVETYRLIDDLMYGSKLIFRVGDSDTATISLYRSVEPISNVLKACKVPSHD